MRILVLDGEQRSSLAAVRSLGRAGHEVLVGAGSAHPLAGASRHAAGTVTLPAPSSGPDAFVDAVRRAVTQREVDWLLPMTDTSTTLLVRAAEAGRLPMPGPDRAAFEAVSDKQALLCTARERGLAVPEQRVIEPEARTALPSPFPVPFPVVLKPARSAVRAGRGIVRTSVSVAADRDELVRALAAYPREVGSVLAQQQVRGPGLGVFLLRWDGRTVAAFAHRRIREKPPQGGVSVYRESVALPAPLLRQAEALLGACDFRGVAMVEFKEDAATGTPYLMEVNARFWGSLQLAIDAGVDFPALLVDVASGRSVEPVLTWREGIRSRWLWGDVDHLLAVLRAGPATRRRHPDYPGRLSTLARFLLPWRPGDRYEVLRPSDPRPFLRESALWFRSLGG